MAPTGKNVFRIQSRRVLSPRYSVRPAAISTALLLSQAFPKAMLFPAAFRCMAKAAEGRPNKELKRWTEKIEELIRDMAN
jgi:hypothetical protein